MKDLAIILLCLIIVAWLAYEPSTPHTIIQKFEYKRCCHYETSRGQTIVADSTKYHVGDTIRD